MGPPSCSRLRIELLPQAPIVRPVDPAEAGIVSAIDVRAVGVAIVALGGGRTRETDPVDHAVGLTEVAALGEAVGCDRPLAVLHARDEASFERRAAGARAAFTVADGAPARRSSEPVASSSGDPP